MRETRQVRNAPHGFRGSIPAERHVSALSAPRWSVLRLVQPKSSPYVAKARPSSREVSKCQATRLAFARGFADVSATTAPNGSCNIAPAPVAPDTDGGTKRSCATLNEPKRRSHHVIGPDVAKPVRWRTARRCWRGKFSDADALFEETNAEEIAVKSSSRIDIGRTEFIVKEPVHVQKSWVGR